MIDCSKKEDSKWSEKRMEAGDDGGLRTVECLRGRLLAERQASKTAKEDAQVMGNKLIELENKLKEETKLRNKAEKRLKLLRKKLESLTTLPSLEELEKSSAVSCVSSSGSSGTNKDPEKSASKSQISVPETPKNVEENASDTTTSATKSDTNTDHEDITSSSSLKASTVEIDHMSGRSVNYEDDDGGGDDHVDNSLALVPMKLPETNKLGPDEIKIVSKSIGEVLDTLRHARERIQSSMERRQMIRVGPS